MIAGKAIAFKEAASPEFGEYAHRIVSNASQLADCLAGHGFRMVSGGTDTHMIVVDLQPFDAELTGKGRRRFDAGITLNKNTVPTTTRPICDGGVHSGHHGGDDPGNGGCRNAGDR